MKKVPYTIAECQKSIRESLKREHLDPLHGWIILAKIADEPGLLLEMISNAVNKIPPLKIHDD